MRNVSKVLRGFNIVCDENEKRSLLVFTHKKNDRNEAVKKNLIAQFHR